MERYGNYSEADGMKALAAEYKKSAAILAVRLKQLPEGSPDRNKMVEMLKDMRHMADTVGLYYDAPRPTDITSAGFYAKGYEE